MTVGDLRTLLSTYDQAAPALLQKADGTLTDTVHVFLIKEKQYPSGGAIALVVSDHVGGYLGEMLV